MGVEDGGRATVTVVHGTQFLSPPTGSRRAASFPLQKYLRAMQIPLRNKVAYRYFVLPFSRRPAPVAAVRYSGPINSSWIPGNPGEEGFNDGSCLVRIITIIMTIMVAPSSFELRSPAAALRDSATVTQNGIEPVGGRGGI